MRMAPRILAFLLVLLPTAEVAADRLVTALTDAEMAAHCARLRAPDYAARRRAADEILALGPSATPALMARLARRRVPTPATLWNALRRVEPSRMTEEDKERFDPLDPLLRAPRDDVWAAAIGEDSEAIVVIRALGRGRTVEGLSALIAFMPRERQTFRREVAKALLGAADYALPSLIRCKRLSSDDETKRFCRGLVADLGKTAPADAVDQWDNELLAAILQAYGDTRDPTAMRVVASFVSSEREVVRDAARRATAQYGGNAIWALRQAWENATGQEPPTSWDLDRTTRELYALHDRARTRDVDGLMNEGLRAGREGQKDRMLRAFDRVLTRSPRYERRKDMVPGLLAVGEGLLREEGRERQAASILRKAYRLDPEGLHSRRIQAHLAYLDGAQMLRMGIADAEPFRAALRLDPAHPLARGALEDLEARARGRKVRRLPLAMGVVLGAVSLLVLIVAIGRARGRQAAGPPAPRTAA